MVTLLSMVICLTHLSMDLVLLDTQEEQPLMLLDQAQELASVVLMLSPMVSMDLFITVCLLTLSEELTKSMPVVDTLSNMCPWAREVPNLLSRTMAIPMLLPMLLFHLQLTEFTSSILVQDTPSNTFPGLCLFTGEVTRIIQNHIFKGNLLHL